MAYSWILFLVILFPFRGLAMNNLDVLPNHVQVLSSEGSLFGCRIHNLKISTIDPVLKTPSWVEVSVYESKKPSKKAVIILPPTGGVNVLDQGYANELCRENFHAVIVKRWLHQNEVTLDYSMHNSGALRAVEATTATLDFLMSFKIDRVGLLGTSIGAITGALVIGMDDRVQSSALIVGSARFADVVADSDESGAQSLRKKRMNLYQIQTIDDYRAELRKNIKYEPSEFLKNRISLPPSLILTATKDSTVMTTYQKELVTLLPGSKHIEIRGNHLDAIKKSFFFHRGKIVQFFKTTLAPVHP